MKPYGRRGHRDNMVVMVTAAAVPSQNWTMIILRAATTADRGC